MLVLSFANIFSHSVSCLFALFMVSFAVHKFLIMCNLFIFVIFITLGGVSKIAVIRVEKCFAMFPSKSFIISSLTFR